VIYGFIRIQVVYIIIRFERRDPSSMSSMRLSYIAQSVLALYRPTVASIMDDNHPPPIYFTVLELSYIYTDRQRQYSEWSAWPALSPDVNPIEHVCMGPKKYGIKFHNVNSSMNLDQLETALI